MAPEVASGSTYDVTADIWSLGIFAYEMAKGSPPHAELRDYEVVRLLPKAKTPSLPEGDGSPNLREFISLCLQPVPSEVRTLFYSPSFKLNPQFSDLLRRNY
jgi:serine/threonine protein kinase